MSNRNERQLSLALMGEVEGIEMGVLQDGTAFLTGRGLAKLCGVVPSAIIGQRVEWSSGRRNKFGKMLQEARYNEPEIFIPIQLNGVTAHAYSELVCMTFLEYFAFESPAPSNVALEKHRKLARAGLRLFVYQSLGYQIAPAPVSPPVASTVDWQKFHARLLLVSAPNGFFSVFQESAPLAVNALRVGLPHDEHSVPDISIGIAWAKYWKDQKLASTYGERRPYEHFYPKDFPQSASNPQLIFVYPMEALGVFRLWLTNEYLPNKFPTYIAGKIKNRALADSMIKQLTGAANITRKRPA